MEFQPFTNPPAIPHRGRFTNGMKVVVKPRTIAAVNAGKYAQGAPGMIIGERYLLIVKLRHTMAYPLCELYVAAFARHIARLTSSGPSSCSSSGASTSLPSDGVGDVVFRGIALRLKYLNFEC